jgi:hypothetical protein
VIFLWKEFPMRWSSILDNVFAASQLISGIRISVERRIQMEHDGSSLLDRREFLMKSGTAGLALALGRPGGIAAQAASAVSLPPLPYAQNALEPVISGNTLSFHYGKHHQAYVNNTVKMVAGT